MNNIKVLDCTLRDGGYINNWKFGKNNIKKVLENLALSNVDLIECGYLSQKDTYFEDYAKFNSVEELNAVVGEKKKDGRIYVCMINFGEYNICDIPEYDDFAVEGIRVAFHKKDVKEAVCYCGELAKKGYKVFVQPMVTINYTDSELLELVKSTNEINPYAFYIVDSFGVMRENDLMRMYYLVENNLNENVLLGYHSHNNLQLSYSNATKLASIGTEREIIIDSCILGMGRGAGNLNTELFIEYVNSKYNTAYSIDPLLKIADEVLNPIYAENYWGYSLPHYLSATHNCHPNYASFLAEKNILTVNSISQILAQIPAEKRTGFDKKYIEKLYVDFQNNTVDDTSAVESLKKRLDGRKILILGPGNTVVTHREKIEKFIAENNPFVFSMNYIPDGYSVDCVFMSNVKRFEQLKDNPKCEGIEFVFTSNLKDVFEESTVVNYTDLITHNSTVVDNAALMLINLMLRCKVKGVSFAGFDGYSYNASDNYSNDSMTLYNTQKYTAEMNYNISLELKKISNEIKIEFITPTKYEI